MKDLTLIEYFIIAVICFLLTMIGVGACQRHKLRKIEQHMKAGTSTYQERVFYKKHHRPAQP